MIAGVRRGLQAELRPMLQLAVPVVLAELGWMSMGVVDTIMLGRVSAEAIGAVSIGGIVFFSIGVFGTGLLLGLDPLVSHAYGAGRIAECHRWLLHGLYLALALSPLLMGLTWLSVPLLKSFGIRAEVLRDAIPYMSAIVWATPPILIYSACRRYLQAIDVARPVMFALVSANVINAIGNWMFIYGRFGAPKLGAVGCGISTSLAMLYLALFLLVTVWLHDRKRKLGLFRISLKTSWTEFSRLLRLGLPAALQITLEVSAFGLATLWAGRLETVQLAAHQIALNLASVTFMVPLGVSSAGAVRVGQALGRRDPPAARRAGWTAVLLGAGFMACAGLYFLLLPETVLRVFTDKADVIATGVSLLFLAALFQLFDGLQVVTTGVLRGAGDTRTPMICHLAGYWVLGIPIGYVLCFVAGWEIRGLWAGLTTGLIAIGAALLLVWSRKIHALTANPQ